MIVYQKQIEYKQKSTSESVLDTLLAKNLSKRLQSSKNDTKKLLDKEDVEQCLNRPSYSKSVKDIPKCQVLECEKCFTVTVDPLGNENRNCRKIDEFNSENSTNEAEIFFEDRLNHNAATISKMLTTNCKPFSSQLSTYNKSTNNDFIFSELSSNKSHDEKKRYPQLKKLLTCKNSQITNISNLLSTTDVSGLQIITKTTHNSHHNILNTITLPNSLKIKKHSRKFKLSTSTNILGINSSGAVNKKTPHFRQKVAVHIGNYNSIQQLTDLGISNLLEKKENPEFSIENFLINLPISRNGLSVIASTLPRLCSEYNRDNGNTNCVNEMINLKWAERNFIFNLTAVNLLKKKLLKNCFNTSVFLSYPRESTINSKYISMKNTQNEIEYSIVNSSIHNSYFGETCSTSFEPAEATECMSESYTLINLWNHSRPSLESFITKKLLYKNERESSTKKRFELHKFGEKAVVILEHIPLIEQMVNSGKKCTCCEFLNLKKKPRRKNKILVAHKQNTTMQKFRKKKKLCDKIENINEIISSKYPIVLLPRIDLSRFTNRRRTKKPEQIMRKENFLNHTCSSKCKCFQSNPVVILIKLDALLLFDKILQNPVNVKSEEDIIDLTDM
ncbi:hypothetical protein WA026_010149 [Henosepilachna vigintioctopunctata]|uniref:Uncharacterized protein n=1 Tax=Henosepilachna vigintioctopunctata TaxID=420089 RepID=A0AAW1UJI1_9CUCU